MITSATQIPVGGAALAVNSRAPSDHHGFSFHDFLSAINPLQYLPVVGTIYRAATGDVIPEPLRRLGSLLVSGLLGGPLGVMLSLVTTAAEKISGVDPEKIVAAHFNAAVPPASVAAPEVPAISQGPAVAPAPSASVRFPMTPAQLAAYGVRVDASGGLRLGKIRGADVLNTIELGRHAKATAAYAANQ